MSNEKIFDRLNDALKYLVEKYGVDIYRTPKMLVSYLSDLAPQLVTERRLLRAIEESGAICRIAELKDASNEEQIVYYEKTKQLLCEKFALNENAVAEALNSLTKAVGWDMDYSEYKNSFYYANALATVKEKNIVNSEIALTGNKQTKKYQNGIEICSFSKIQYLSQVKEDNYQKAKSEYLNARFENAFDLFSKSVSAGNIFSIAHLGIMRFRGEGCKKDKVIAFEYFKKGAELGCPLSTAWLTEYYRTGSEKANVKQDKKLAKEIWNDNEPFLEMMCDENDYQALYFYGTAQMEGLLSKTNVEQGIEKIRTAKQIGYKKAAAWLGECTYNGTGLQSNYYAAFDLLSSNYDQCNAYQVFLLGLCYYYGNGTKKDPQKAFTCFKEAYDRGNANSITYLSECYKKGFGTTKDKKRAETLRKEIRKSKKIKDLFGDIVFWGWQFFPCVVDLILYPISMYVLSKIVDSNNFSFWLKGLVLLVPSLLISISLLILGKISFDKNTESDANFLHGYTMYVGVVISIIVLAVTGDNNGFWMKLLLSIAYNFLPAAISIGSWWWGNYMFVYM